MNRVFLGQNLRIWFGISIGVACWISVSSASAFSLSDVLGNRSDTMTSVCETQEPVLGPDGKPSQSLVPVWPGEEHLLRDVLGATTEAGTTTELFYACPATPCGGCSAANASSGIRYSAGQAALDLSVYMLPIVFVLGWHRRKSLFRLGRT